MYNRGRHAGVAEHANPRGPGVAIASGKRRINDRRPRRAQVLQQFQSK